MVAAVWLALLLGFVLGSWWAGRPRAPRPDSFAGVPPAPPPVQLDTFGAEGVSPFARLTAPQRRAVLDARKRLERHV